MRGFVKAGMKKTSFDLPLTAPPCCRIITSFMKPLEKTNSSDSFSNVHLVQLGSGCSSKLRGWGGNEDRKLPPQDSQIFPTVWSFVTHP